MNKNTNQKRIILLQLLWIMIIIFVVVVLLFASRHIPDTGMPESEDTIAGYDKKTQFPAFLAFRTAAESSNGPINADHQEVPADAAKDADASEKTDAAEEDKRMQADGNGILPGIYIENNSMKEIEKNAENDAENNIENDTGDSTESDIGNLEETQKKRIALTFDDGPNPGVTNRILDILKEYNAKATFFVMGNRAASYKEELQRILDEGHQIGNHTYSHKLLTELDPAAIQYEVEYTNEIINAVIDVGDVYLRPPYGASSEQVASVVTVPMVGWSIDSEDWKSRNKEAVIEKVLSTIHENGIILMHDLYLSTAEAVEELVPQLIAEGYELVTVKDLFEKNGMDIENGKLYMKAVHTMQNAEK